MTTVDPIALLQTQLKELERRVSALENPAITLDVRRRNREMEGLQPGWPFWLPRDDRAADYEGLSKDECRRCGHVGQSPRYWYSDEPRTIVSFAVCDGCGHSEPF